MHKIKIDKSLINVIIDTREKENKHIEKFFIDNNIGFCYEKLNYGDYSVIYNEAQFDFRQSFVIERKASLGELSGNLTKERDRFVSEHNRCKADGAKMFWMIESGNINSIFDWDYSTRFHPNAYIGSVLSMQAKYNIQIDFVQKHNAGKHIYAILYYNIRECINNIIENKCLKGIAEEVDKVLSGVI
jgi:ERCC4-type nuclease